MTTQHRALQTKVAAAGRDLAAEKDKSPSSNPAFRTNRRPFSKSKRRSAKHKAAVWQTAKETEACATGLARLAAPWADGTHAASAEGATAAAAKKYSLVPYKGRRGDRRRPLYVECTITGVIFHPDRQHLEGLGISAGDIRREVQRRIDRRPNPAERRTC